MHLSKELKNIFLNTKKEDLISYKGPITFDILVVLGNNIKRLLNNYDGAMRKVHKIFVELAQNISAYSAQTIFIEGNDIGVGTIILEEQSNCFTFVSVNMVKREDGDILVKRCSLINSLDREGLRVLKREKRLSSEKDKLNAHIGLIHASLISGNLLDVELSTINEDYSYITIKVTIEKN